jgi:hypothetical protein
MELSRDFSDLLRAFSNAGADFLIVGAHAVGLYDRPRTTKDLDVWIRATPDNARRVWNALAEFGAPLHALTIADLTDEDTIFQIGVAPLRIDILTSVSGVTFDDAWRNRVIVERDGMPIPFIGVNELLKNKEATGRAQDLLDAARVRRRLEQGSDDDEADG